MQNEKLAEQAPILAITQLERLTEKEYDGANVAYTP